MFTVRDNNGNEKTINVSDISFSDVFNHSAVHDAFSGALEGLDYADSASELWSNVTKIDGSPVTQELLNIMKNTTVPEGCVIEFDMELDEEEEAAAEDAADNSGVSSDANRTVGLPGMITVSAGGGAFVKQVPVVNGTTTIQQVMNDQRTLAFFGFTASSLASLRVYKNDNEVFSGTASTDVLSDGDRLNIVPKVAGKDGLASL